MGFEGPYASRAILWRPAAAKRNGAGNYPSLYWAPRSQCPAGEGIVAYSTDDKPQFVYEPFNQGRDFGPLDIARTVMYCRWVEALCDAHSGCSALVHVVSDTNGKDRANTVVLCGAYLVLCGASAEDAFRPFAGEPLPPFVDCRGEANPGSEISEDDDADFKIFVLDVLRGLERARDLSWVDYRIFDVEDHSSSLRPERGDMSWLLPGRALALASPWGEPHDQDGLPVCTPALLCPFLLRHHISLVVQCNNPEREEEGERRRLLCYEPQIFRDVGVQHLCIPFEDGGCPSVELVLQFLAEVEAVNGAFAVHCRSGLGRTATLIGAYAIRHFEFTARSFIGWVRAMRPGTVHGSQQQYLVNIEPFLRPGATRTLEDLDQRERLTLLPRRELRFWALDCGISAARTRHSSEAELIEMVLTARGIRVPPKPVAPPARALAPVLRTQAQVQATGQQVAKLAGAPKLFGAPQAVTLKPAPQPVRADASATRLASTEALAFSAKTVGPVAKLDKQIVMGTVARAPKAQGAIGAASENAGTLNNLNAAIASLGRNLHNGEKHLGAEGAQALVGQAPLAIARGISPSSGKHASSESNRASDSGDVDEWAEVLRYLHLRAAMQEGGVDAWESVRQTVELLRAEAPQARAGVQPEKPSAADQRAASAETAAAREALQAAQRRSAEEERELRALRDEAASLERESGQLRAKLHRDREAQRASRAKMEERGEALVTGLKKDEERLEGAVRDVEGLRGQVMKQGGMEQWQVERVEQLRRDIVEARATTLHHTTRCRELRASTAANATAGEVRQRGDAETRLAAQFERHRAEAEARLVEARAAEAEARSATIRSS